MDSVSDVLFGFDRRGRGKGVPSFAETSVVPATGVFRVHFMLGCFGSSSHFEKDAWRSDFPLNLTFSVTLCSHEISHFVAPCKHPILAFYRVSVENGISYTHISTSFLTANRHNLTRAGRTIPNESQTILQWDWCLLLNVVRIVASSMENESIVYAPILWMMAGAWECACSRDWTRNYVGSAIPVRRSDKEGRSGEDRGWEHDG